MSKASDFLCVGDYICLYCEETEGYVYSWQTSSVHNGLYIYQRQEREGPQGIPNPQAVVFQLCIQNRYKLNKKYRKSLEAGKNDPDNLEIKAILSQAKLAANAENEDNVAEQKRQQDKRVRYGEIIQLKHMFTGKFIHVSTTQTSRRDKNNMMVTLQDFNAKHAQFRILPRYKVKSEGEVVQMLDQIVFESVKSPGQFFHASVPWTIDHFQIGSELNLGVDQTGFTIVKHHKPAEENCEFVRGGSAIRLFHKELEAYVVVEGLFQEELTEEVHLRIREVDQLIPKTLYPSSSGITFWQIEAENSILQGDLIRWEQQVRFRHMTTRLYLCMDSEMQISVTSDAKDPNAVFRLHPIIKETDEIPFETYARIEHVMTGFWLHALKDEEYVRRYQQQFQEDDNSMSGLRWDGAVLRKIAASGEKMYHDAYTVQRVEEPLLFNFNYVAGMVPLLLNLIEERKGDKTLTAKRAHRVCQALQELKQFMIIHGVPTKERQKLMRNLRIIDLLVRLLQFPLKNILDETNLTSVFKSAYDVLHTYMIGNSRKNALYFAKYIDFFQTQFSVKGDIGLNVAQMIVELIRDNRKIVDRITKQQIDEFTSLLRENKNYRYLDLLSVLCVCDGVAIPDNQTYITKNWLVNDQNGVFLTERGQNIKRQTNVVYVSMDTGTTWHPLHDFVNRERPDFSEENCLFLEHQLDLFRRLCYGRNEYAIHIISREMNYLTWEEGFLCLRLDLLPHELRAKYCDLIIGLFVDIGNNYSVLEYTNTTFVYDDIDARDPVSSLDEGGELVVKDLVTIFPVLRDWITEYLDDQCGLTASHIGHNMLIEQVLRLLHYLVKFGYYGNSRDIRELQKPLLNLLDGKNDRPFPEDNEKEYSKEAIKLIQQYKGKDRYEQSPETSAIVNVKFQAMQVLDLLLTYQFNTRLRSFVGMFKQAEISAVARRQPSPLQPLLYKTFDALDQNKRALKEQKRMVKVLEDMFDNTAYFDADQLKAVLLDLSNYKYDKMVTKSLALLNKYFSSKTDMFKSAVEAQVLVTPDSCRVHREVLKFMPILRRLSKSKLNEEQAKTMGQILETLTSFCHLPFDPEERHPMNQSILYNHEVLSLAFDNLSQEIDAKLVEQYRDIKTIVIKHIRLLQAMAKGNDIVQKRIFDRMDTLLKVRVVESDIAAALKEAFVGNQSICLKVQARQIQKIVSLIGELQEKASDYLSLLSVIVKVEGLDIPLKRNQAYVMKYIMQSYSKIATVFDQPREAREKILIGEESESHLKYLVLLVDLLATCAEGDNRFIESLCQTIISMEEILWVLNHQYLDNNIKKCYLKYLHCVYMRTCGSFIDTGAGELTHDPSLWSFVTGLITEIQDLANYLEEHSEIAEEIIKSAPPKGVGMDRTNPADMAQANLHFVLETVLPFLKTFFSKFYSVDRDIHPQEPEDVNCLAGALLTFCDVIKSHISNPSHLKIIMAAMTTILPATTLALSVIEGFIERFGSVDWLRDKDNEVVQSHENYYSTELELNAKFRTFAVNSSLLYGGHNTVAAQLKCNNKYTQHKAYTQIGADDALPLGEEFQQHIQWFLRPHEKKLQNQYRLASKLVEQLRISASRTKMDEAARREQEELDFKCLQLLRAMVHNEICKLPDDWEENTQKNKKQLKQIKEVQCVLDDMGALVKVLPLLARNNDDIARETLAFMSAMLFNANKHVQKSLIDYFRATREEVFFLAVRNRMQLSTIAIKERRALVAQHEARVKEVLAQAKSLQSTMTAGRKALQDIQNYESQIRRTRLRMSRRASLSSLQFSASRVSMKNRDMQLEREREQRRSKKRSRSSPTEESQQQNHHHPKRVCFVDADNKALVSGVEEEAAGADDIQVKVEEKGVDNLGIHLTENIGGEDALEYKDEGYIELVLQVLARMCDGQNSDQQDYLRDQPDNIKSFNIVAETTAFLNMVYSNINPGSIDLTIQIFTTLNEFASGNQPNRVVLLNRKIVTYINFILRAGEFEDCEPEKILELRSVIGNILYTLIEENGPEPLAVAKEVKDTIDKEALYRIMAHCYEMHQIEKPKWDEYLKKDNFKNWRGALQSAKQLAKEGKKYMKEKMEKNNPGMKDKFQEVGFTYFFILIRFYDIDSKLNKEDLNITPEQEKAFRYYKKNSMSIELLKDNYLQKVHFRVKNKNVLREEVKEKLKWSVDRSSPSNKIRDLMMWSKDILKDIYYQKRILSNFVAAFLTRHWLAWNYSVIILSMVLNMLMLLTWQAKMTIKDVPANATTLPKELYDPIPKITLQSYNSLLYILGGLHNVASILVLISYFLSNHPQFPSISSWMRKLRNICGKKDEDDKEEKEAKIFISKLDVQFFSFKTFYYMTFVGLSMAGTAYHGYFFAFHLLNIVNNNQLLGGVIQAVTQNGKSLVWVAILFLVIFYIYAIIGFAIFRSIFDPEKSLFCDSLWQCTVTIVRYGLIGDYDEVFRRHKLENNFTNFSYLALYQISFFIFITTIGLNIIFGIIVDTFSELRDLKWTAESDMRDTCFVCSRNSYDFEHHGLGFSHHVRNEHNMWAYIFFFIHLDDTKENDFTALDLYVSDLLKGERYDFFPLNRALSLTTMDEDSTESKIDELLQYVLSLVQKQKEEESEKKRQEERRQQQRWQEQHRHALRLQEQENAHDPEFALRRFMQVRDTGRRDWVAVEFETTHL